jgi:hypothetical protein
MSCSNDHMDKELTNRLTCLMASGLCGVGWLSSAIAAPPVPLASRPFVHHEHTLAKLLDLRPPGDSSASTMHGGGRTPGSESFPSAMHHVDVSKENPGASERYQSSGLGNAELNFRGMSDAETLVRRIHREGLPVARLWDSKSALLSIGLNQRGKPGIWLTQKVR